MQNHNTNRKHACLCEHVVAALHTHTPVAYLCLGLRSKSPVNQTEVIRNCLHRRSAIVCPDGELTPPEVLPARRRRHAARLEIPSQIKSEFRSRYLIPATHLISCSHLRSCLGAAIRRRRERNAVILLLTDEFIRGENMSLC